MNCTAFHSLRNEKQRLYHKFLAKQHLHTENLVLQERYIMLTGLALAGLIMFIVAAVSRSQH